MSSCNIKDDTNQLHIIFLPYMAPGHLMPMVDIARVFANQPNTKATIITTPANAARFHSTTSRDVAILNVSLPLKEVGLPEGCENLVSTPTRETTFKLFKAIEMLHPKLEIMLLENNPDCIVSDYLYPWTVDVAHKLGIPRLAFSGGCFFNNCVCFNLEKYRPHDHVLSENQEFVVPNLPDEIVLTRSQLQDIVKGDTKFNQLFERIRQAEMNSFGVLMNSFYGLESHYANYFKNEMGINSWHIGPLFLFNKPILDEKTTIEGQSCLDWLNSKVSNSVLYICFGSLTRFTKSQLIEMASALKDSGCSFIWVLGKVLKSNESKDQNKEEEWWLPNWFEDNMKETNDGLVIRGWAPQAMILEHRAIGGFLTHCGWNSILEGVCAGVPLITWPVFADQFYNEKLVTQVLKIGVEVGNMVWKAWAIDETEIVEKEKIKIAIKRVMGEGKEGEEIRKKVKEFSELAHKAVKEGGSSYNDVKALFEVIRLQKQERLSKE
ncbi:UDP-glucose flavonoid 3-O-glucosyltransferase 7 [Beta vulgaris subsp. vulgaris]|uniref:UDP-glucose flavonoid 3-O-glucosyltransferase 7 n=1 Tax=Beta vulgaris subsp. vulgaris TaxID=3555 RepID=UPI002036775A|nr:UDP-glucose flavonoid 3-O-glucosyltransferase 7 [Beta vulgaris subsp. vulgaris]